VLFVALAVLCDEWLVPHLGGVQRSFRMSDDVAGVTLMAFGGAVRMGQMILHFQKIHSCDSLTFVHPSCV
jgi:hypothetical protein